MTVKGKFTNRKVTKEEINFTIRMLETLRKQGLTLDQVIEILKRSLKNFDKKKGKLFSIAVMKFSSQDEGVYDEVMVLSSLEVAKKIVDSLSLPIFKELRKKKNLLKKVKFLAERGEVYAVFEKETQNMVYKNEELSNELNNYVSALEP